MKERVPEYMTDTLNHFLLIGNGRLSRHLQHYFASLHLSFDVWTRSSSLNELYELQKKSTHVLIVIQDSEIEKFYLENLKPNRKQHQVFLHFSGALTLSEIVDLHPLMTFGPELYDLEFYKKIPFITSSSESLSVLLPGLKNIVCRISAEQKPHYHALCVLGGNFSSLLIKKMMSGFSKIGLPQDIGNLFIQKTIENILKYPESAVTGPLIRKDTKTIQKNLEALKTDPYFKIYQSFVEIHTKEPQI